MTTISAYVGGGIAGCFAFWAWLRLGKSVWWLVPGMGALALFAYLLTLAEVAAAGRGYAAYGGVYIAASLAWLWLAEGVRPTGGMRDRDRHLPDRGRDRSVWPQARVADTRRAPAANFLTFGVNCFTHGPGRARVNNHHRIGLGLELAPACARN